MAAGGVDSVLAPGSALGPVRQVGDLGDHLGEAARAPADGTDGPLRPVGQVVEAAFLHHLDVSADRRQRRANFVVDGLDQTVPELVEPLALLHAVGDVEHERRGTDRPLPLVGQDDRARQSPPPARVGGTDAEDLVGDLLPVERTGERVLTGPEQPPGLVCSWNVVGQSGCATGV